MLRKSRNPHIETIVIDFKLFYSPWAFYSFILVSVYIAAQACEPLQHRADQITNMEHKHPASLLSVHGANLTTNFQNTDSELRVLPGIKTWDHCCKVIKDLFCVCLPCRFRMCVKRWTNDAKLALQTCFDYTVRSVFEAATTVRDKL